MILYKSIVRLSLLPPFNNYKGELKQCYCIHRLYQQKSIFQQKYCFMIFALPNHIMY